MTRIALVALLLATVTALGVVTSQHKARRLFTQLEQEQARTKQLEVEFGQLQLEQSTWAMHARIERLATEKLGMRPTESRRTHLVPLAPRTAGSQEAR